MIKIITDLNADLNELLVPSEPIELISAEGLLKQESESIIKQLLEEMEKDKTILALAAPQIGIRKRLFCIRFNDAIKVFINPIIKKKENYSIGIESSVSLPGKELVTDRPNELTVVYYNEDFKYEDNKLLGPAARLFDQMVEILDGWSVMTRCLVSDIEKDGPLNELSDEEFHQLVDIYKNFSSKMSECYNKHIESDEELKKNYRKLKFAEKVANGGAAVVYDEQKLNRAARRALKHSKTKTSGGKK